MSTQTPYMNLIESTVNVDSGLQWEENLNSSLTIIDQHNHSPGYGVQITPTGLNINANLSFAGNAAINLQASVYTPQLSLSTTSAVYSIGADLYYNDANGNVIQITSGGAVNATSSGISSGSATASFVSSVLVVNAASNTPANIQCASVLLGNNSAGSKFLTLTPPLAMGANYSLTLPSLPAAQQFMTLDSSGNISAPWVVDNSTLQVSSNVVQVKDHGITAVKLAALGQQVSATTGAFVTSSSSFVDVTNATVTITTTGRPIMICLNGESSSNISAIASVQSTAGSNNESDFQLLRGATVTYLVPLALYNDTASINSTLALPPSSFFFIDVQAAGTYTYKLQARVVTANTQAQVTRCVLLAYEL